MAARSTPSDHTETRGTGRRSITDEICLRKRGRKSERAAGKRTKLMCDFLGDSRIADIIKSGDMEAIRQRVVPVARKLLAAEEHVNSDNKREELLHELIGAL